jgi:hypothetical protein
MIDKNINYIIISLLLPAIGLMLYMNWCGLGLTSDSVRYLSEVELIREKGIIYFLTNGPLTYKPPGFALFVYMVGIQNLQWLFIAFFAIILSMSWTLIKVEIENPFFQVMAIFSIGYGIPFYLDSHFLWAEMPFLLILILMIKTYLHSSNERKKWIWIALMGAVLIFLRYAGIFIVMAIVIDSMIHNRKIKNLIIYVTVGVIALSPLVIWFIINPEQFGSQFQFLAIHNEDNLLEKTKAFSGGITLWFLPDFVFYTIRILLLISIIVLYFFFGIKKNKPTFFIVFTLLYFFLVVNSIHKIWSVDLDRFMSVVYIPIMLMFFIITEYIHNMLRKTFRPYFYYILVLLMLYPTVRTLKNVLFWHDGECVENKD